MWTFGVKRQWNGEDKIRNSNISNSIGLASIVDKIKENRLRWLGHVIKRGYIDGV